MELYIGMCISFGLMFMYRYTREIIYQIVEVAKVHEVEQQRMKLGLFAFWMTILSVILMPAYAIVVLFSDRQKLIKDWSRDLLVKYYNLELKSNN